MLRISFWGILASIYTLDYFFKPQMNVSSEELFKWGLALIITPAIYLLLGFFEYLGSRYPKISKWIWLMVGGLAAAIYWKRVVLDYWTPHLFVF